MDPFAVALVEDVIDVWEYWILKYGIARPLVARPRLNLENLAPDEIQKKFRFQKPEIFLLVDLLRIPATVILDNGSRITAIEILCCLLRRFATKGRAHDLVELFGREESDINRIFAWGVGYVHENFCELLTQLDRPWLTKDMWLHLASKCSEKGCPFEFCIGFLDGTLDPINRCDLEL